ncbi:MAG TPA: XdhC family protein [Acidobacteriaceae bacterium]|nr:XdhC family protein [Acidobacteriaceae bacterium]
MMDRRRIVQQWNRGAAAALVTLVRAEGSSYRAPGAHLLIGPHGEFSGSISGGCLEAEVVRKATWMARNGAVVERYSTLFDDTAEIPFGLGCGGIVDLLIESTDSPECHAFIQAAEASLDHAVRIAATWLPHEGRALRRAVLSSTGEVLFRSESLTSTDVAKIADALATGSAVDPSIYIEHLCPPQRLFVLGAGDDAKPVVTIAALLGWNVIVADGRAQLARIDRFPGAQSAIATASVEDLGIASKDCVVLMTHSYEQDRTLLTALLRSGAPPEYIGLLGASHRSSLLVHETAAILGRTVAECCARIWSPVGLDLGGDGPEAIALAVVSEIQAWHNGKLAASRRLTAERVAEQIANRISARYLQTECASR